MKKEIPAAPRAPSHLTEVRNAMSIESAYANYNAAFQAAVLPPSPVDDSLTPQAHTFIAPTKAHTATKEDVVELMGEAYWWQLQVTKHMARITAPDFDTLTFREQSRLRLALLNAQTQLREHTDTQLPLAAPTSAKPVHSKGDHHHSMTWTV